MYSVESHRALPISGPGFNMNVWNKIERHIDSPLSFESRYGLIFCLYFIMFVWLFVLGQMLYVLQRNNLFGLICCANDDKQVINLPSVTSQSKQKISKLFAIFSY